MHCAEIITEAQIEPAIRQILKDKGYKFIDYGQDQDVYLAPDGTILKIFGWDMLQGQRGFSLGQQSFIDFANFCRKNPGNPFLPDFSDWATFEYNGKRYLQIKSERLFPIDGKWRNFARELQFFAESMMQTSDPTHGLHLYLSLINDMEKNYPETSADSPNLLILTLGKEGLKKLADTIGQIKKIGQSRGYDVDLHSRNFMFGSDGQIVINDPFWGGGSRRIFK